MNVFFGEIYIEKGVETWFYRDTILGGDWEPLKHPSTPLQEVQYCAIGHLSYKVKILSETMTILESLAAKRYNK